jgi:hypothetical protein
LRAGAMRQPQSAEADDHSRRENFENICETGFCEFEFHGARKFFSIF